MVVRLRLAALGANHLGFLTACFAVAILPSMFQRQAQFETPLLAALRQCNTAEQHEFAALAETTRNYLYQMATCKRSRFTAETVRRVAEASKAMHVKTTGRVPKLSMEEISQMCTLR